MDGEIFVPSYEQQQELRQRSQSLLFGAIMNTDVQYSIYTAQTCMVIQARVMDWVISGFSDPTNPVSLMLIKVNYVAACLDLINWIRREKSDKTSLADLLEKSVLSL